MLDHRQGVWMHRSYRTSGKSGGLDVRVSLKLGRGSTVWIRAFKLLSDLFVFGEVATGVAGLARKTPLRMSSCSGLEPERKCRGYEAFSGPSYWAREAKKRNCHRGISRSVGLGPRPCRGAIGLGAHMRTKCFSDEVRQHNLSGRREPFPKAIPRSRSIAAGEDSSS